MRVPVSWLREIVELPKSITTEEIATRLTAWDLKLEEIISAGVSGPLVVGRVLTADAEKHKNGKTVNWCRVDVGPEHNDAADAQSNLPPSRGIVCGAHNFGAGDLVVVSLPGTVLPGGFVITARKTYGHVSDGMICSGAELGISSESDGIVVLPADSREPGDDAISLLGLDEETLALEVNPDRAYALSMRGVARDTALAFDVDFNDPAEIAEPTAAGAAYEVRVEDPEACPTFAALNVNGVDQSRPTPGWMARRIELAGMRPISLAVDITNYVMLELGQPIHGYDRDRLRGPIVVRRARKGEKLTTLDSVNRTLDEQDLLICDDRGPIGLAGVMGGEEIELSDSSRDIVIEAACFDPATIARTARMKKLPSEASKRFERGVDPALALHAAKRVADLLIEHGGGTLEPGVTVIGASISPPDIKLDADLSTRVTGVDIDRQTVESSLKANGCWVEVDGNRLTVTPPTWRMDLADPYDLVEEVLRVVGYDKVPSILPVAPAGRGLSVSQKLRRRAGYVLSGEGLTEVKTFPFAGPVDFDNLGLEADDPRRSQVKLANPLSAEQPGMTTTLLAGLLTSLTLNIGRGHHDVSLVETGRVFLPVSGAPSAPIYGVDSPPNATEVAALDAALPHQPQHVGIVMAGDREKAGWYGPGRPLTWADPIEIVRRLAASLHVRVTIEAAGRAPFHPGRCAAFLLDGQVIGYAGELHPGVVKAYGIPERTVAAEVDLDALIAAAPALGPKPDFSTFPVAKEDIALVVDQAVTAQDLKQVLLASDPLIETVRLFDVYQGDQVPVGKKSLAFSLRLRADDRTLKDDEIKSVRSKALAAAAELGAQIRS